MLPLRKGIADEQLAKAEQERGRKRERESEDKDYDVTSKRMRSTSTSSVSTISTNMSRSPSPRRSSENSPQRAHKSNTQARMSRTPTPTRDVYHRSVSPLPRPSTDSERKRRRGSVSSVESYISEGIRESRERTSSRNTRRRYEERSPLRRGRPDSRSPHHAHNRSENNRPLGRHGSINDDNQRKEASAKATAPPRERSMSPFSKRLALTQAMNGGR